LIEEVRELSGIVVLQEIQSRLHILAQFDIRRKKFDEPVSPGDLPRVQRGGSQQIIEHLAPDPASGVVYGAKNIGQIQVFPRLIVDVAALVVCGFEVMVQGGVKAAKKTLMGFAPKRAHSCDRLLPIIPACDSRPSETAD
jgi:hypothetical protein